MSQCKSCGAEILWAVTRGGKRMPLDAEPSDTTGLFRLVEGKAIAISEPLHVTHFATCPNADQHRKEGLDGESTAA